MGEEKRKGDESEEAGGPGSAYTSFVLMEGIIEKLKLLNYEKLFCKELGFKPLTRHFFALQTNPGEKFFTFTSLSAWLIRLNGKHFDPPQEFDDPNATISSLLLEVKGLGHSVDFPPAKLKSGCGEQCIDIVNKLCDSVLVKRGFTWSKPMYPKEQEEPEDNAMEDEAELDLQKVEDEMAEELDDEFGEEESLLDLDAQRLQFKHKDSSSKPENIMVSSTTAADWKLELERVLPQLKVTIRTDNKDWRQHVEQMHTHSEGIEKSLTETKGLLSKLHEEITKTLDKIATREKYLNGQLEHHLGEFRAMQDQLAECKERYKQASGGVTERTKSLAEVSEELERIKMEMEERGSSMTDGAPLVKIKQAMQNIKKDIQQMDIRMGVLEHCLMQAKLKEKAHAHSQSIEAMVDDV